MENQKSNKAREKRKRGLWSPEEDTKLYNYITTFGVDSWSSLPRKAGLERCEKSCRLRWVNHLDPKLKKSPISPEEERQIISLHNVLGNSWSKIAESLPGRTDNEIKNFWNCHVKKKIRKLGTGRNSKEPSGGGASMQGASQTCENSFATAHTKDCKNEMQTHETREKFWATLPSYNHASMSSTSLLAYTENAQKWETENGIHNLGNQSSQLTVEAMDDVISLRDYMNSLAILINLDENGSIVRDDSIDSILYY